MDPKLTVLCSRDLDIESFIGNPGRGAGLVCVVEKVPKHDAELVIIQGDPVTYGAKPRGEGDPVALKPAGIVGEKGVDDEIARVVPCVGGLKVSDGGLRVGEKPGHVPVRDIFLNRKIVLSHIVDEPPAFAVGVAQLLVFFLLKLQLLLRFGGFHFQLGVGPASSEQEVIRRVQNGKAGKKSVVEEGAPAVDGIEGQQAVDEEAHHRGREQ